MTEGKHRSDKGRIRHVVSIVEGRALLDRQTLAMLTGRSVNTIRARCPVAEHQQGKAMYDMEMCEAILNEIPTRRRAAAA